MAETPSGRGVIPSDRVHRTAQPVLVENTYRSGSDVTDGPDAAGGTGGTSPQTLTVIPVMDNDDIVGFEVRCACGSNVMVGCLYDEGQRS